MVLRGVVVVTRAVASRIRRLEAQIGWRAVTFVSPDGRELILPTGEVFDAALAVMLDGEPPNLLPDVCEFIATSRMRKSAPGLLLVLRDACRGVWAPKATQAERDRQALNRDADPPSDEAPVSSRQRRVYGGASRA